MSLLRIIRASTLFNKPSLNNIISFRAASYWNKDWKPGAFPLAQEERIAAAKKYGMLSEDYQTFEDDGYAPGDYPKLQEINELNRDPWEYYDLYPQRRNYGEPLCWHQETLRGGWYDPHIENVTYGGRSVSYMVFWCIAPFVMFALFIYTSDQFKYFAAMMRRQYPYNGEVHYIFDTEDEH